MTAFNETFEARFWKKVHKTNTCWLWTGARVGSRQYGQITCANRKDRQPAHRASYVWHFGEIPEGLLVCHRCDNPPCVNPDHLFLGTQKENLADMVAKQRSAVGSRNGRAELTEREVKDIISVYANGGISQRTLALRYGVCQRTITNIVNKNTWKHVNL